MARADLPSVMAIAARVHPAYPEDEAVIAERLRLAPSGCKVLRGVEGAPSGYLLSHPWPAGEVPALNSLLGSVPGTDADWYLHDLALLPTARGRGAAGAVVTQLAAQAAQGGYRRLALVALDGSAAFWARHGFTETAAPALVGKLATYGAAARYMRRELV